MSEDATGTWTYQSFPKTKAVATGEFPTGMPFDPECRHPYAKFSFQSPRCLSCGEHIPPSLLEKAEPILCNCGGEIELHGWVWGVGWRPPPGREDILRKPCQGVVGHVECDCEDFNNTDYGPPRPRARGSEADEEAMQNVRVPPLHDSRLPTATHTRPDERRHEVLDEKVGRAYQKWGVNEPTIPGIRLGIACLEDEVRETLQAWERHKRAPGPGSEKHLHDEIWDVAAVAFRLLRDLGVES
jgi:hypothetical protein